MRIGLIAPPWRAVPPTTFGATEVVVDSLARALADAGHDVRLFTTGDSTCPVPRRSVFAEPVVPSGLRAAELRHVEAAYHALEDCDVIHDHTAVGSLWAATREGLPPIVTTAHGPFNVTTRAVYGQLAQWGVAVAAVSRSQRDSAPDVPIARIIHHGIDPSRYPFGQGAGGYALFLGSCSPEGGVRQAIDIARRAGVPLRIATTTRESGDRRHFEQLVEPHLGPDVAFLGELSPEQRNRELAGACALLDPLSWAEPFGLVMIEALACGTPVIAYPFGAAPEIVDDGITGFLCHDVVDSAAALQAVGTLDRRTCRRAVQGAFSARRMAQDYSALYRAVASHGTVLTLPVPVSPTAMPAEEGVLLSLTDRRWRRPASTRPGRHPDRAGAPN